MKKLQLKYDANLVLQDKLVTVYSIFLIFLWNV